MSEHGRARHPKQARTQEHHIVSPVIYLIILVALLVRYGVDGVGLLY